MDSANRCPAQPYRRLRLLGQAASGLAIGSLLVLALFELTARFGDLATFKYQGF